MALVFVYRCGDCLTSQVVGDQHPSLPDCFHLAAGMMVAWRWGDCLGDQVPGDQYQGLRDCFSPAVCKLAALSPGSPPSKCL